MWSRRAPALGRAGAETVPMSEPSFDRQAAPNRRPGCARRGSCACPRSSARARRDRVGPLVDILLGRCGPPL
eukprot:1024672-Prorocentrum_lima.AAC.1